MAGTGTPCAVCGMVPTSSASIQWNVGLVVFFRITTLKKPLCKVHGRKITREYLRKSLLLGWWGAISFFVNIIVVFHDLKSLGAFRALADPTQPAASSPVVAGALLKNVPVLPRQGEWRADPYVRHQYRWIVGSTEWTDQVCDDGQVSVDPPGWVATTSA